MIKNLFSGLHPKKTEHYLMLMIFIFSIGKWSGSNVSRTFANSICAISTFIFIFKIIESKKRNPLNGFNAFIYSLFIFNIVSITAYTFIFNYESFMFGGINDIIGRVFFSLLFVPSLMPLIILCLPKNYIFDFSYLFNLSLILLICFLLFYPFAFYNMINFNFIQNASLGEKGNYQDFISNSSLGIMNLFPATFLIFQKKYLQKKHWKLYIIAYIGALIIGLYLARRGRSFMMILNLICFWILYLINNKNTSKIKIFISGASFIIISYLIFSNISDSFFSLLMERGIEDSRTKVEESFWSDMSTSSDLYFGRGWFGTYYEPIFKEYRDSIETGYLALILRGGYIYLLLYISVLGVSAYKGLFKSKNLFVKSFALLIILSIIELYPYGWPQFNFNTFIIWLGVYICNNKTYRLCAENKITSLIYKI